MFLFIFFFFQAEDGIRDLYVTGVQTCALPLARRAKGLLSETSIPKGAVRSGQRARSLRVREPAFYFAMQMFFGSVKNSAFAKPPSSRFGAKGYGATGSAPLVSEFILRYKHSWPR